MSNIRLSRCLIVTVLLVMAGTSPALTIGRHQGVAVLGRPLDLQIPVGLDSGMDPADLCPEVEVSYGDMRLGPRLVDVQMSGAGESLRVRVRVAQVLDEPFAAVQLRIGCAQKLSRRFMLLAEPLAGEEPPAIPVVAPIASEPALPSAAPSAAATGANLPPIPLEAASSVRAGASAARPRARAAKPEAAQSRLQLDPLAIRAQSGASSHAAPPSAVSPMAAASALAPAPAASSPAEAARVQALEDEVRKLQDALVRSQAAAAQLRTRIDESERERFANPLVYALGLGCAGLAVLAALAWRRTPASRAAVWWQEPSGSPVHVPDVPSAPESERAPTLVAAGRTDGLLGDSFRVDTGVPLDPAALAATGQAPEFGTDSIAGEPAPPVFDGDHPAPLSLSTQELSDVQQEADFFVSLGEYDRAIDVLRSQIDSQSQPSPMAWLDLLAIQHKLGRQEDYEQVRRDFEALFKARIPAFEAFDAIDRGLEDHSELLASVQALWPDPAVADLIHDRLFRAPVSGDSGSGLGLQAYRDLLFLHQMAQEVVDLGRGSQRVGGSGVVTTSQSSRVFAERPGLALVDPVPAPLAPPSPRSLVAGGRRGLDIDLDEVLAQPSAAPDPRRERKPGSPLPAGIDELIDFDLETDPDSIRASGGRGGRSRS